MRDRGSRFRGGMIALLLIAFPLSANAVLYGVAYDRTLDHESLVEVSTVDASITDNAAVALPGCCRVNGSLVASDAAAQTVYFVSTDPAAWQLHRISMVDGSAVTASLPAAERIGAILRLETTSTLYALSDAGAGLRLVTVSDAGAVTEVGSPIMTDCCAIRVGVAALSADASQIAFVGRLKAPADATLRLFVISASTGDLVSSVALAHAPDVLYSKSGTEFSAIYHDAGTEYVGTIAGDGSFAPIGTGLANCCAMFSGVSALRGNVMRVVARELGSSDLSIYEVKRTTGLFSLVGTLPSRYVINGLVESDTLLQSDLIFADGFELPSTVTTVDADKRLSGTPDAFATTSSETAATDASGANGAQNPGLTARNAQGVVGTNAGVDEWDQKGFPPPRAAVALPLGSVTTWGVLTMLMLLLAMRFRRRLH
jgi:hypothetical protein